MSLSNCRDGTSFLASRWLSSQRSLARAFLRRFRVTVSAVEIRIAAGTVSLIAGVLASIQTFLRFGARAEQHRVAAERWAAVKREIEKVRALPAEQVGDANELLDDIKARMDQAADKSPAMPKRRWSRALAKQERAAKQERTRRKGRTA